jgi:integrase
MRRKRTNARLDNVFKRCQHGAREHDDCRCPWYFKVQAKGRRERGKLPNASTREEARSAVAAIVKRMEAGLPAFESVEVTTSTDMTVEALAKDWLSLERGRKSSTRAFYTDILRAHVIPTFGARTITSLSYRELERFLTTLEASRGTRKKIARTLRTLFGWAVLPSRLLTENPAAGLVHALKNTSDEEAPIDPSDTSKYFPAEEARVLLDAAEKHMPAFFPFVFVALGLGLRKGEIKALRYDRINWDGSYVTIDQNVVRNFEERTTKTKRTRTVSVPEALLTCLRDRWIAHGKPAGLVFPSRENTPLSDSRILRDWQTLMKLSGLPDRTLLACRHTHTSILLQKGVPVATVANEAGRTIAVTERVYAHFIKGGARKEAELLASALGRPSEDAGRPKSPNVGLPASKAATRRNKSQRAAKLKLVV